MQRFSYFSALLLAMLVLAPVLAAQPVNDQPNTHLPILIRPETSGGSYSQSNAGATTDITPSCGLNADNGIWYAISTPQAIDNVEFNTFGSDFDTVLAVYRFTSGSLVEVACSDDADATLQSQLVLNLQASNDQSVYLVQVSGFSRATGNVSFNVSTSTPVLPPHLSRWFEGQMPTLLPGTSHPSSNLDVPPQTNSRPAPTCGNGQNNAWRVFVPPTSGFITIDTFGSDFDTVLSVESAIPDTELACNDDAGGTLQSRISNFQVTGGQRYLVRVTGFRNDRQGTIQLNLSSITGSPVSNETAATVSTVSLDAAYPNPFAGRTSLAYTLPSAQDVRVVAYDVLGREVAVLAEGTQPAGEQEVTFDAASLPSGIYVVRLTAGKTTITRRVTVVR